MRDRVRDYSLLLIISAFVAFPNLGSSSFWDQDEGLNAEASREMKETGTWIIPTFNYQLRTAKPVMINWLQRMSYAAFGVDEWSARFPSALAGCFSIVLVYELARRMFDRSIGLLSALILASVANFTLLVHASTPDSTLLAFTVLAYLLFWTGHTDHSRRWWTTMAVAAGLAFLTKGPIAVVLPAIVVCGYFAWNRELSRLFDFRIGLAFLIFILVAGPWYGLVAAETRGEWLSSFFKTENLNRFLNPMDRHSGILAYYLLIVPVMYAPWCVFLLPTIWYGLKEANRSDSSLWNGVKYGCRTARIKLQSLSKLSLVTAKVTSASAAREVGTSNSSGTPAVVPISESNELAASGELTNSVRANRFLLCWTAAYVLFFSAAATKLPHYVFPIYPAMAILTARFLIGWRRGEIVAPRWLMPASIATMVLVGVVCVGCIIVGNQLFPGIGVWAALGLIPIAGAAVMGICLRKGNRGGLILAAAITSLLFIGFVVSLLPTALEPFKGPKELVRLSGIDNPNRDIRLGQFEGLSPSLVFYAGREVKELLSVEMVAEFLSIPTPAYLIVMESTWNNILAPKVAVPARVIARRFDLLREGYVVVVTNEMPIETAVRRE